MPKLDRSLIAELPPFAGLTPDELEQILQIARSARYPKDTVIFEQEAEAHSFYLLLDGYIRVMRSTPEGQQVIVRYINPGELFGIAAALGRSTYPANAIAAVDCVALVWPHSQWAELAARFPSFGSRTYHTIGARLQDMHERVTEMATEHVEQRVALALLRLIEDAGRGTEEGTEIDFPISRQHIAEMTGTTLHTVSRLLSAWEGLGLVHGGRQKVTVLDPQGLAQIAHKRAKA